MIGTTVTAKAPFSSWPIIWVMLGFGLAAFHSNVHLMMLGLGLLMLGFCLWWFRPRSHSVLIEDTRLVPLRREEPIEYSAIRSVSIGGLCPPPDDQFMFLGPIHVLTDKTQLYLPEQMSVSPIEFYSFLVARMSAPSDRTIAASLQIYNREQTEKFGSDKIQVFHARNRKFRSPRTGKLRVTALTMLLIGSTWVALVTYLQNKDLDGWGGLGVVLVLFGSLFWVLQRVHPRRNRRHLAKYPQSCIVLSPAGMAMDQGDLKGKLRWEEITGIKNSQRNGIPAYQSRPLIVKVAGGQFEILDIYEKPLREIAREIARNTRKEQL